MLEPITCRKDPIPPNLLEIISCSCDKSGCTSYCTCRKLGLKCTVLCKKCNGISCANTAEPEVILSDDEDKEENFNFEDAIDDEIGVDFPMVTVAKNVHSDDEYEPDEKKMKM